MARRLGLIMCAAAGCLIFGAAAKSQSLLLIDQPVYSDPNMRGVAPQQAEIALDRSNELIAPDLRRQMVHYVTRQAPGTIVIDTKNTFLYYVLSNSRAIRYGIGVGREGFTWSGTRSIERKMEWPDWNPPAEMIARQPYLPRFMAGGPGNPLGARAMYLSGTLYRIHGTSEPSSIGKRVSSGCIRMLNDDAIDLYGRTSIGTKVVVLPDFHHQPMGKGDVENVPYYGPSKSFNAVRRPRF